MDRGKERIFRQGFILLYRKIRQNFLWEPGRPRTRLEAWADIVMEAQHSYDPQPVLIKGRVLHCHRGESLKSLECWAERWRWSKTKTRNFLRLLEKERMVVLKSERITTRLTVVNYDTYQFSRNTGEYGGGAQSGPQGDLHTGHRQRMYKQCGNKGKEERVAEDGPSNEQIHSTRTFDYFKSDYGETIEI